MSDPTELKGQIRDLRFELEAQRHNIAEEIRESARLMNDAPDVVRAALYLVANQVENKRMAIYKHPMTIALPFTGIRGWKTGDKFYLAVVDRTRGDEYVVMDHVAADALDRGDTLSIEMPGTINATLSGG